MHKNLGSLLRKRLEETSAGKVGYKIEIKIFDQRGAKAFEWRAGQGNLILGILVLIEFVEKKIGIDMRDYLDLLDKRQPLQRRCIDLAACTGDEDLNAACEH